MFGRFSTITYGVCVPSMCSHRDVEAALKHFVDSFTQSTGLRFAVQVNEPMCQVRDVTQRRNLEHGEILTM